MESQDQIFMRRALDLAAKGRGAVAPNPLVGCVIVKNGKILAEGYHKKFGGPHAEIEALKKIGFSALGATLYVTLEPCHHHGKTPPCVDAVIRSGVRRVVIASTDPNPLTAGKSVRKMRRAGLLVTVGVCKAEAQVLNRGYFKWIVTGMPYVICKFAMSLDGKIAEQQGKRTQISGKKAQRYVQDFRRQIDAILVGRNTVVVDDPFLNVRKKSAPQPKRVILDSQLQISPQAKIFHSHGGPVILCTILPETHKRVLTWRKRQVHVLCVPQKQGRVDLQFVLKRLPELGVSSLVIEGGAQVLKSLQRLQVVDEWQIFVAPKIFGPKGVRAFENGKIFKKPVRDVVLLSPDLLLRL